MDEKKIKLIGFPSDYHFPAFTFWAYLSVSVLFSLSEDARTSGRVSSKESSNEYFPSTWQKSRLRYCRARVLEKFAKGGWVRQLDLDPVG